MNTTTLRHAQRPVPDTLNTKTTTMRNTLRTTTRTNLLIGFTVLIERLALVLGRPTRLA